MRLSRWMAAAIIVAAPSAASAETLFGLTSANQIVTFDSATPGSIQSLRTITGLNGATLVGLDLRPANNTLYSMSTTGNIYSLTLGGGNYVANLLFNINVPLASGGRYGFDFNPAADRLRVVTDFDGNLRINVDTGITTVDGPISAPGAEALTGVAYTNNVAGATSTAIYAVDAGGNQLLTSAAPNSGVYTEVGTISGLDFGALNITGFDISGRTGTAYFNIGSGLYTLNLGTAAATSLGTIGTGPLIGLTAAAVPEPATWAMMIGGIGAIGGTMRRRSKARVAFA